MAGAIVVSGDKFRVLKLVPVDSSHRPDKPDNVLSRKATVRNCKAQASFVGAFWSSGPAPLGYGDGDEATVISFGPDANNKYITTYFRRSFSVTNASTYTNLTLRLLRDDGAVVYLNGVEVFRSNMPAGPITFTTLASTDVSGAAENTFVTASLNPALLVNGTNVLAVEVHQSAPNSDDLSFDLELVGIRTP